MSLQSSRLKEELRITDLQHVEGDIYSLTLWGWEFRFIVGPEYPFSQPTICVRPEGSEPDVEYRVCEYEHRVAMFMETTAKALVPVLNDGEHGGAYDSDTDTDTATEEGSNSDSAAAAAAAADQRATPSPIQEATGDPKSN